MASNGTWQQVTARLGTSPCIKAGRGKSVGGKGSGITPLSLLGIPQEDKLHNYNMYAEGLGRSLVAPIRFSVCEARLVESVGFLGVSVTPLAPICFAAPLPSVAV